MDDAEEGGRVYAEWSGIVRYEEEDVLLTIIARRFREA